jgi:alkyldihydroxyacetonephosphate synthase
VSALRSLDETSLLVDVSGDVRVADVEAALAARGLTLGLTGTTYEGTIAEWLANGAPGARSAWLDPVDHLIAGFTARLGDGRVLDVRPAPRRAVGPDQLALFFGTGGRFGVVASAWLRVHRVGAPRPVTPFVHEEPSVGTDERALWDALARELER